MKSQKTIAGFLRLIVTAILVIHSQGFCAHPFINDFNPYSVDPAWEKEWWRDMAIDDLGNITLIWSAEFPRPNYQSDLQIYYRRLKSDGTPLMPPTLISDSAKTTTWSSIKMGHNRQGRWVLANQVEWNNPGCVSCYRTMCVWRSNDNGILVDTAIVVGNSLVPTNLNLKPVAAIDSAGNFGVFWVRGQVGPVPQPTLWGQLYLADGSQRGNPLKLADSTVGFPGAIEFCMSDPHVAMMPNGDFVIAYFGQCDQCPGVVHLWDQVFYKLFHADGTPKTGVLCATCDGDSTDIYQNEGRYPDIAIADNGDFAIFYTQLCADCDPCQSDVVIRRFYADGRPKGQQLILDSNMCDYGFNIVTCIRSDAEGNLIVSWTDDKPEGGLGNIYARRFGANGETIGSNKYRINNSNQMTAFNYEPTALNSNGLTGFFWLDIYNANLQTGQSKLQLMDYNDVGFYVAADANNDHVVNISDAVFLISYIFAGGQAPAHSCLGDANGDGSTNISDVVALVSYIFSGGSLIGNCPN